MPASFWRLWYNHAAALYDGRHRQETAHITADLSAVFVVCRQLHNVGRPGWCLDAVKLVDFFRLCEYRLVHVLGAGPFLFPRAYVVDVGQEIGRKLRQVSPFQSADV